MNDNDYIFDLSEKIKAVIKKDFVVKFNVNENDFLHIISSSLSLIQFDLVNCMTFLSSSEKISLLKKLNKNSLLAAIKVLTQSTYD